MNKRVLSISILASMLASFSATSATYQVTEIQPLEEYRQHFAMDISDSGQIVGVARDSFNFPYYLESYLPLLTLGTGQSCDVSEEEFTTGVFDSYSSSCLKVGLSGNSSRATYQKVGDNKSFITNNNEAELIHILDVVDPELGAYTSSNVEQLRAINDIGIAVGEASAPYLPIEFTQTGENAVSADPFTMWQREFSQRAVVYVDGVVKTLDPIYSEFGGETSATDISNTGYISGQSSTLMSDAMIALIEKDCTGELEPVEICVWSKRNSGRIYESRPVVWQVDGAGNVLSTQVHDLAFEPTEEQTGNYFALAMAVNDSGKSAGFGNIPRTDGFITVQPLIFSEDGTETFIDVDEYYDGFSTDINNSNVVVGTVRNILDGAYHGKFFVYDETTNTFETPTTFYETAKSNANSINDAGLVVGEAEYEITTDTVRRKHGFIYNSVTKEFFDINDLVECDSPYELVELKSINNSNQIAATALKYVDRRDSLGEIVKDDDGVVQQQQVALAVLLEPITGEIEDCGAIDNPPYERQGLSLPLSVIFILLGLVGIRRKK